MGGSGMSRLLVLQFTGQHQQTQPASTKRTQILFIFCANSPPIFPPLFNLFSTAANIDVVYQMTCAVRGGGEVIRAPPDVVDDKLEVVRRRRNVDHRLEAFRTSPIKQRRKERLSAWCMKGVVNLFVIILSACQLMFNSRRCIDMHLFIMSRGESVLPRHWCLGR